MNAAVKKYKQFHGRLPTKVTKVNVPYPKKLVLLGEGVAIEYKSDKKFRNKPRRPRIYRHKFGRGVQVFTDPKGKALYLLGGRLRVTNWMRY